MVDLAAETPGETITRRVLVPTERQRSVDDIATAETILAPQFTGLPGRTRRRSLRSGLAAFDPRGIEGPRRVLVILSLTSVFSQIDNAALGVLLPQIRDAFNVDVEFFAVLSSAVSIVYIALSLPMGYLADRVRRVWMVRAGTLAQSGGVVAQGLARGVAQLVGARLFSGAAVAISPAASYPLMADYFPTRSRARVFAFYFLAAQAGVVVGPAIAGLVGAAYGFRITLVGFGLAATVVGLLAFWLREPARGAMDRAEAGFTSPPPAEPALSWGEAFRAAGSIATLRRVWYSTPFLSVRGFISLLVLPFYFTETFQLSTAGLGLLLTVSGITGLIGLYFSGPIGDRLLTDRPGRYMLVMGLGGALQAASIVVLALSNSLWLSAGAVQLTVLVDSLFSPAFFTLISMVVPARVRGLGLQTQVPWQLAGLVLYPALLGVAEHIGLHLGIIVFAPAMLIGAVILGTGAGGVERDIRAARAASVADDAARRAREEGLAKMLVCRDVDVSYAGLRVLSGVDFDVTEGEVVALLGTNGAGKSTLLRAIAGVQEASNGAIFLDGRDITHMPPHEIARHGVVMVPGGHGVFPTLTVAENLRTATAAAQAAPPGRMEQVLGYFPVLAERADQAAGTLSGGEQQMLALAQAFLLTPRLLLIDELTLGLAPPVVSTLLDVLAEVRAAGTTIVLVEQSLNVAVSLAERAVYLERGEVRFDGPTADLIARPDLIRSVFMGGAVSGPARTSPREPVAGTDPVLQVTGLAVRFGGVQALAGVDLRVNPAEIVGVIGPNGAGKTTLFDAICGFVPATGQVRLDGKELTGSRPDARARAGLGRSFQSARLFPSLTVRETIATYLERRADRNLLRASVWTRGHRKDEQRLFRRVDRLVDSLGLGPWADTFVGELSTGTRRAVDMACVLALEPKVLLLDEPSSGLAQAETEMLAPLMARISREIGAGLLVIEHDVPLITSVAHRLVAMDGGKVLADGDPGTVRSHPDVLASYLAASETALARSGTLTAISRALHEAPTRQPNPGADRAP